MSVLTILNEIEEARGSNAKIDIFAEHADIVLLRRVLVAALDPSLTYYVTKVDDDVDFVDEDDAMDDDDYIEIVLQLLDELNSRAITGNAAKTKVKSVLSIGTERQGSWFMRILLRNLRIGLSTTSINKVVPDLIVPFSVMLAHTLRTEQSSNGMRIIDHVRYPVRVEPKLDGLRLITVKSRGKVTMYTRNGTVIETLPSIVASIAASPVDDIVLDGEAMGKDWNESASVMMSRTSKKDDSTMVYNVFDAMSLSAWNVRSQDEPLSARSDRVISFVKSCASENVVAVPFIIVTSETELRKEFSRLMSIGHEGAMVKRQDAPYEWKRSKSILKLKPVTTYEGVVVGLHTGRVGTKNEHVLSGLNVMLPNGVKTRVGSGLNDSNRADIQLNPDKWIGAIVECEAQPDPMTTDGLTVDGKMRFPIFVRERDVGDVSIELRTLSEKVKAGKHVDG